jgi:hypothetical protein
MSSPKDPEASGLLDVQMRAAPEGPQSADVHEAAEQGISGAASRLPHLDVIQRSFGRHDVRSVHAHVDGAARSASEVMGAEAFATGNSVAFRDASPSLHTAAHEAAHVVQQRAGVSLAGGVGEVGDPYERHADAVADLVVRGENAEPLLDEMSGGSAPADRHVQRKAVATPALDEGAELSRSTPAGSVALGDLSAIIAEVAAWGSTPFPSSRGGADLVVEAARRVTDAAGPAAGAKGEGKGGEAKGNDANAEELEPKEDEHGAASRSEPGASRADAKRPVQRKTNPSSPKPPDGKRLPLPKIVETKVGPGETAIPENVKNCLSWAGDDFLVAPLGKVNTLRSALDAYITSENAKCAGLVKADIAALRELDETTHGTLTNYQQDLELIKNLHGHGRTNIERLTTLMNLKTTLNLVELDQLEDKEKSELKARIDTVKADLKARVSALGSAVSIGSNLALAKFDSVAIEVGKQVVMAIGNQLVDDALKREFDACKTSIESKYNALAAQIAPNTSLESVDQLAAELANVQTQLNTIRTDIATDLQTKQAAIGRLKATTTSLLSKTTSLRSFEAIKGFLGGASTKGGELNNLADGLLSTINLAPDFAAAAATFQQSDDTDRSTVEGAIASRKTEAEGLAAGVQSHNAIPADKRWMFSEAFLDYAEVMSTPAPGPGADPKAIDDYQRRMKAAKAKHPNMDFDRRPGSLPQTSAPVPAKFSAEYNAQLKEAEEYLAKSNGMASWATSMASWKTEQVSALQAELAFTSGQHTAPANELLRQVMEKLGPGSAKAARAAGGK